MAGSSLRFARSPVAPKMTSVVGWTGNRGTGTSGYRDYSRDHDVSAAGPPVLPGSSDPHFHGDADRWNPEELLVAALSQCHLLAFLHAAADSGVVVVDYADAASGTLHTEGTGGRMTGVVLRPVVTVAEPEMAAACAERTRPSAPKSRRFC